MKDYILSTLLIVVLLISLMMAVVAIGPNEVRSPEGYDRAGLADIANELILLRRTIKASVTLALSLYIARKIYRSIGTPSPPPPT